MFLSRHLLFILSFVLVILTIHLTNGIPINSDVVEETSSALDESDNFIDDESRLSKRRLPMEGILIGRRSLPGEGILIGRRSIPGEGILIGRRSIFGEGILIGKRYPTEGILLGKRNTRFLTPKLMAYNSYEN